MSHRVGLRVKKVRGDRNVGNTGIVIANNGWTLDNVFYDVAIRHDQASISDDGRFWNPGKEMFSFGHEWEPIVDDGAGPSRYSFEELMDKFKPVENPDESRALVIYKEKV